VPTTTVTGTGNTGGTGDTRKAGDACKTDDNKDGTLQENEEGILVCVATTTTTKDTCSNGATNYPDCDQCPQGQTLITGDDGVAKCGTASTTTTTTTTTTGTTECDNGATVESNCTECPQGQSFITGDDGIDRCGTTSTTTTTTTNGSTTSDTCANGATNYPDCDQCPSGEELGTDEEGQISCVPITRTGTTDTGCTNGAIDSTCSECADGSKVDPNNPDDKCPTTVVTTPPPSGGGDDGGNMFGSSGLGSFSPAGQPGMFDPTVTAAVSLEQPLSFPIRDFLLEALPENKRGMMTGFKV